MKILYIAPFCTETQLSKINSFLKKDILLAQAIKFHRMAIDGLVDTGHNVDVLSSLTVHYKFARRIIWKINPDRYKAASVEFITQVQFPILKEIFAFLQIFKYFFICKRLNPDFILIDSLNIYISFPWALLSNLLKIRRISLVTDLPKYLVGPTENVNIVKKIIRSVFIRLTDRVIGFSDGLIVLTKHIADYFVMYKKPFIVIEGFVDEKYKNYSNTVKDKNSEFTFMFAGMLEEKFGIKTLVKAFMGIRNPSCQLVVFGTGSLVEFLDNCQKVDSRIKFRGLASLDDVFIEEIRSDILINPRPSKDEYVKYSFPSKNLEYMSSGTPLLALELPGIPIEYYTYMYLFQNETEEGIRLGLEDCLLRSREELVEFGSSAKKFVYDLKNSTNQALKIIEFLNKIVK